MILCEEEFVEKVKKLNHLQNCFKGSDPLHPYNSEILEDIKEILREFKNTIDVSFIDRPQNEMTQNIIYKMITLYQFLPEIEKREKQL